MTISSAHGAQNAEAADPLLAGLNTAQRAAVAHFEGPLLVLAGAGSGKTRVLTTRIARLIEHHGVDPRHILAVTFTNKAAGEMRARIGRLLGAEPTGMWMGTFHAIGARMLRAGATLVGRTPSFTIYDEDDALGVIKRLMEKHGVKPKEYAPKLILSAISDAKNALVLPDEYASLAMDPFARTVAPIYRDLEPLLRQQNAATFDDLLLLPVEMLRHNPHKLEEYRQRFHFILVDEYQDTNRAQYQLVKMLGGQRGNVMVVGDDDQCLVRGTSVRMSDGSERPIERVRPGDEVLSNYGSGDFRPARVAAVHERRGRREGIRIRTRGGREIVSTPEHTHFAGYRLGITPQTYFTYLMRREGVGCRLGTTQVYTNGQEKPTVGFAQRLRQEHGDELWIVSTHDSENEARTEEYILSLRYQIPTLPFVPRKSAPRPDGRPAGGLVHDEALLRRVFDSLDTEAGAERLLRDRGLSVDHPHHRPRSRNANRRNVVVTLCGDHRGSTPMHRISLVGNDDEGSAALRRLGLSVRPAKSGSASWRHETANSDYGHLRATVELMSRELDVNVVQVARLGRNGNEGILETNSLPFIPAGSVMPGMAMFDDAGGYDIVTSVDRVDIQGPVYDLDIEPTHNYIAAGLVTHNSIYGWRGADIRNILDFEKDFPNAGVVRLEENYRSTPQILTVANAAIAPNTERRGKTLRATRSGGERVTLVGALDDRDEADWVLEEIQQRRRQSGGGLMLRDFSILYRTNAQSRTLEESMRRHGVPYRLIGAVRFYDRREIRDLMSYLKLIANPADDEAFRRAINVPRRGLGDTTVDALAQAAGAARVPMLEAAGRGDLTESLRGAQRNALLDFSALIARMRERAVQAGVDELLRELVDAIRYGDYLRAEGPESAERLENVRELVAGAAETVADEGGEVGLTPLDHFLQRASLVAETDKLDPNADAITMMTIHNAKGLEFPVVFITGLEDGLFPLSRAFDQPSLLEEERRLFYVGITRAERKLYMSHARSRRRNGETLPSIPSSFLAGIPGELVEQRATMKLRATGRGAVLPQTPGARRPGTPVAFPQRAAAPRPQADEEASQDSPRYVKGERVRHKRFGAGTISELSGAGADTKVTVDFDDEAVGRKRLVVAYAGLEKDWD